MGASDGGHSVLRAGRCAARMSARGGDEGAVAVTIDIVKAARAKIGPQGHRVLGSARQEGSGDVPVADYYMPFLQNAWYKPALLTPLDCVMNERFESSRVSGGIRMNIDDGGGYEY